MNAICLEVAPGICNCDCTITASTEDKKSVQIEIRESECEMIQNFAEKLREVSFSDMFVPLTRNKVTISAEKAKCHLACPVPVAVLKAAEAAMTLALPQDVQILFR